MRALEEFCREILRAPGVPQWIRERAHQLVPDEPYDDNGQDFSDDQAARTQRAILGELQHLGRVASRPEKYRR